jgi:hypothetical protein
MVQAKVAEHILKKLHKKRGASPHWKNPGHERKKRTEIKQKRMKFFFEVYGGVLFRMALGSAVIAGMYVVLQPVLLSTIYA